MKLVSKIIVATMLLGIFSSIAVAKERIVFVTHATDVDTWWNVIKNSYKMAAKDLNVDVEYRNPPTGNLTELARIIEAGTASKPDGLVVTIPDPDALGDAIRGAVASGIPVISVNSGAQHSKALGALMHIGQPEYDAGFAAGERAKAAGAKSFICVNHQMFNQALEERCKGFADGLGVANNMLDVGDDPTIVRTKVTAFLQNNKVDAILTVGPNGADPTIPALRELGLNGKIYFGTFDVSPAIVEAIKSGDLDFAIDQQPIFQGYLPILVLTLNIRYGVLPGNSINSGPGFITKENVAKVEKYAGEFR